MHHHHFPPSEGTQPPLKSKDLKKIDNARLKEFTKPLKDGKECRAKAESIRRLKKKEDKLKIMRGVSMGMTDNDTGNAKDDGSIPFMFDWRTHIIESEQQSELK